MPIFIKKGAIIPMRQPSNWIDTKVMDTITFDIYPSESVSVFDLFEDDGESILYQRGAYGKTTISCEQKDKLVLQVGPTEGNFKGKQDIRFFRLKVNGIKIKPGELKVENAISYNWKFNSAEQSLLIELKKNSGAGTTLHVYANQTR
jgi:alpha-glucosidase (family GH31 glycosyl hydrolase)